MEILFWVIVVLAVLFVVIARRSVAISNSGEIESFDPATLKQVVPPAPVRVPVVPATPVVKQPLAKVLPVAKKVATTKKVVKKVVKKS